MLAISTALMLLITMSFALHSGSVPARTSVASDETRAAFEEVIELVPGGTQEAGPDRLVVTNNLPL